VASLNGKVGSDADLERALGPHERPLAEFIATSCSHH
jgi:hypothetical protein